MSPTEMVVLSRGRIPVQIVLDEIVSYVQEYGDEGLIGVLAEKAELEKSQIEGWLYHDRGQTEGIDFNEADRLFAAMGKTMLWHTRYSDYYTNVNLNIARCACPGCNTTFEIRADTLGRPIVQEYCSRACRQSAYKLRTRRTRQRLPKSQRGRVGRPVGVRETKCRNGHERTPENTKQRPDGRIECRDCANEKARARYAASVEPFEDWMDE